jgi:hypothetical protein
MYSRVTGRAADAFSRCGVVVADDEVAQIGEVRALPLRRGCAPDAARR